MKRFFILALLLGTSLHAQTVGVQGGASTLFGAQGGSVSLFTPTTTSTVSAGLSQGRLVAGASTEFALRGFDVRAGDSNIFLATEQVGITDTVRGFDAKRKRDSDDFEFFAGAVGEMYSVPYFQGTTTDSYGAGARYTRRMRSVKFTTVEAFTHNRLTTLQGAAWHWRGLEMKGTAGLLERQRYLIGEANWRLSHAALDGSRQTYLWQGQRSTVTSAGASIWFGRFDAHSNIYRSTLAAGETAGAGVRLSIFTVRGDAFWSAAERTQTASVTERLRRWSLTQFITRSNGNTTVNFGGSYTSNLVTASLGWTQQFVPFSAVPFQKVLTVSLGFQLPHGTNLNIGTVASPTGGVKWSTYGGSYFQTAGSGHSAEQHERHIGGFEIKGNVLDQFGAPVCGAAIVVGGSTTYSDSRGAFTARIRKRTDATVVIDLDSFTTPGNWEIVSSPSTASPDAVIAVVLKRK